MTSLLFEKVPDEGEKSDGSPEDKKNVAGQEDLGVLAVKSGADMDDHEYRERHQHQRHKYCGNYMLGIGLLILYIVILIIRNIIEPRIIGQQVGLPPIVTLIAMYAGLKIFGVFGMMMFPVATIILVKLQESGIIHIWKGIGTYNPKKNKRKNKKAKSKVSAEPEQ